MRWLGIVCGLLCTFGCSDSGAEGDAGSGGAMAGVMAGSGGMRCAGELAPLPREPDCAPAWRGYDAFYDNLLKNTCAAGDTTCHGRNGGMLGLFLFDRDEAYDYLLGDVDGRARVIAGEPECSVLVQRIESDDSDFRMPPGPTPLRDAERCAIITWIAEGALRQ